MEFITEDLFVKQVLSYISPVMLVLVIVDIGIGAWLKKTPHVEDWMIPYILSFISIIIGIIRLENVIEGFTQGILVVMLSNYLVNLYKQFIKRKTDPKKKKVKTNVT